ncbi:MAG: hypothetical protein IJB94_07780 [Clostridia bacterium]|nr:hypothetical protein [Clostridia bacterium]
MYTEIVEALILSKIIEIFFFLLALVGIFFLVRAIEKHFEKKEKAVPKKGKKKKQQSEKRDSLPVVAFLLSVIFLIGAGMNLYTIFSLRKDMINENYATYTGEFCYEESYGRYRRGTPSSRSIIWEEENGKSHVITYDPAIDDYQPYAPLFKEFGQRNYRGTIVYSPSSDYLLWWDAVPIGE